MRREFPRYPIRSNGFRLQATPPIIYGMGKKLPPRLDNFRFLDPDAPRTKRIIECATSILTPWEPQERVRSSGPPALVELAKRIEARAKRGQDGHAVEAARLAVCVQSLALAEGEESSCACCEAGGGGRLELTDFVTTRRGA